MSAIEQIPPVTSSSISARQGTVHKAFSLARVGAIASNTLLELVRLKVFYFMLLFGLVLIGSSLFMVNFSFQQQFQVLKDVSLGAMSIFSWLLGVLATAMLLPKDVEDRTLYTILAKPVPRFEYLLGKLLGVLALIAIAIALMSALFYLVLFIRERWEIAAAMRVTPTDQLDAAIAGVKNAAWSGSLIPAIVIIYLKAALCASLTLMLSTFASSTIFTIMVSMVCYFVGHVQGIAREYWLAQEGAGLMAKLFLSVVALFFPDLQLFNLVDDIVVGTIVPAAMFWKTAGLGVLYTLAYLFVGYWIFAGKEL
jgi:ABC-type transport system involved in multi-copper enzyme maturation permease subunit